jgi:hypothetical protein
LAFRAETLEDFAAFRLDGAAHAVIKSHRVEAFLAPVLANPGVKVLMTVRDPRDATTSLVQRFGMDPGVAAMQINRSLASILTLAAAKPHLVHFFEDRFYAKHETVAELADFIGVTITRQQSMEIAARFSPGAVKSFLAKIAEVPRPGGECATFDEDTQLHQTHLSDMKIGKWASVLDGQMAMRTDRLFRSYAELFAVRRSHSCDRDPELNLEFSADLFRPIDNLDICGRKLSAAEVADPLGLRVLDHVYLPAGTWAMQFSVEAPNPASISVSQSQEVVAYATGTNSIRFVHENSSWTAPLQFHVAIDDDIPVSDSPPPSALLSVRYQPERPEKSVDHSKRDVSFVAEASDALSLSVSAEHTGFSQRGQAKGMMPLSRPAESPGYSMHRH